MATSLRPGQGSGHYARPSRVAYEAAPGLGLRPGAVEQLIRGHDAVHIRTAHILACALTLDDHALAARILAPIEAARLRASETETPADLLAHDVATDSAEDCPRFAYLALATSDTRNALLRHARQRAGVLLRLIAALEREQRGARA